MPESDFSAVVARVKLLAQTGIDPTLSDAEVEGIVTQTAGASTWAASTAYSYGDYVIPTASNRDGRRYMVTEAGTSAATEPAWPESDGAVVMSGTAEFTEAGPLTGSVYDIRKAVHECWMLKAAKASERTIQIDDARGQASDYRYLNCIRMAEKYQPLEVA